MRRRFCLALTINSQSTVLIKTRVTATRNGQPYNPTTDAVSFAFLVPGAGPTASTVWYPGTWETRSGMYLARCLVGPGSGAAVDPVPGTYATWIKIVDNPETPVLEVDTLVVE